MLFIKSVISTEPQRKRTKNKLQKYFFFNNRTSYCVKKTKLVRDEEENLLVVFAMNE